MSKHHEESVDVLQWRVWPAGQNPTAAFAAAILTGALVWYAYVQLGNVFFAVAAIVVMVGGLASFWLPSTYRLDESGVHVRGLLHSRSATWEQWACYVRGDSFIALSAAAEPDEGTLRDGVILRLAANGDEVAEYLARHLPEWKKPQSGR